MLAPALPATIAAPAPFPAIVAQAPATPAFVAPGIDRAAYVVRTVDGPLRIAVVGIDPAAPGVRLGAVLAHDRVISAGETVAAMANRTGAVAGINADYFDIGQTNAPLGYLVQNGVVVRPAVGRAALWVTRAGGVGIGDVGAGGDGAPPPASLACAVGGGPVLVRDGVPYDDPHAPVPSESNHRFPVAGAALRADGTLVLVAVDGRDPARSIGLTRPQLGALLRGLGAVDAMAFDSGGSATLVARVLGDPNATDLNDPSDGADRPVGDGLFAYSDLPVGVPDVLVLRPRAIRALPGARATLQARIVDAAGHAFGAAAPPSAAGTVGRVVDGVFVAGAAAGSETLDVHAGPLHAALAATVVPALASLALEPARPNPDPGGVVQLRATGRDADGEPVAVDGAVAFTATAGTIDPGGTFHAGDHDATVTATAGGVTTALAIPVGRHDAATAAFAPPASWTFATAPAGAAGSIAVADGTLSLNYDLRGTTRAAYARTGLALPGTPVAMSLVVDGDGGGVALRAAFVNAFGEPQPLTLARRVDWRGPRRLVVPFPGALTPPLRLTALYVVPTLGGPPAHVAGTLRFASLTLVEPGTPR